MVLIRLSEFIEPSGTIAFHFAIYRLKNFEVDMIALKLCVAGVLLSGQINASDVYLEEVGRSFCNPTYLEVAQRLLKYPLPKRKRLFNKLVHDYALYYAADNQLNRFKRLCQLYGVM